MVAMQIIKTEATLTVRKVCVSDSFKN